MNICHVLIGLRKCCKGKLQVCRVTNLLNRCRRLILTLLIIAFSSGNIYAQHLFSVNYNELSQENARRVKEQVTRSGVLPAPLTRDKKGEYDISFSTIQNTKIIILNEETGNSIVVTPTKEAPAQFRLQPFFIKELKQSALGDADRYLIIEAEADFSVRSAASVTKKAEEVFIPRYFYGPKEDVKEALPKDRQIIHIFKEKPIFTPAFPDDPENLRYVAQLEEELSYYVYMYKMPDGSLYIFDENFVDPSAGKNQIRTNTSTNLQLILNNRTLNTLNAQQRTATQHAIDLWKTELAGTVPVEIDVSFRSGILGGSYRQPHYFNPVTLSWYSSALGNQLAGYNVAPGIVDIKIEMGSTVNWSYSLTSPPTGSNQYDWLTVMLHEITHGLGFSTLIRSAGDGNYAYTTSNENVEITPFPGIFDRQLYQGSTTGPNLTDLNPPQIATLIRSNNLFSGRPGSYLLAANGGARVKMHAPSTWASGSSVVHWDNSVTFGTFMKHSINPRFRHAVIGAREIAIMRDIGWAICTPVINFTGQTVDTDKAVINGCGTINSQNTTVTSTGTLNLRATNGINIGPGFTVQQGGKLTVEIR